MSKYFTLLIGLAAMIMLIGFACSDTGTAPMSGWGNPEFADYYEIIEEVAPPPYTAPAGKLAAIDSMWTGVYLKKVFDESEPMSLYSNLNIFDEEIEAVASYVLYNDSLEQYIVDSNMAQIATLTALTSEVTYPSDIQAFMGTSFKVDYLIEIDSPEMAAGDIRQIGFMITDTLQTVLVYHKLEQENDIESYCYSAVFDPVDSTIEMRGVTYKLTDETTADSWGYIISSTEDKEFSYRMSWYADPQDQLVVPLLGCIIGGGDRNDEFALSVREYVPADSASYNTEQASTEVFALSGTTYAEGTSLSTDAAFTDYLDDNNYFTLDDMPTGFVESPFDN